MSTHPKINIINKQNLILESKQMQKILVITMNEDYPFFIPRPDEQTHNNPTLVRRIIQTNECNHHHILGKTTFIKNLRNKNLVKAQDIIDKGEAVYILYENVQSKFDWRDPQIITDVYGQLKNLTTYLANIGVKTFLQSNRIGITETGNLKYYLGVDFQFTTENDDQFLPTFYQNELSKLFGYEFTKNNSNNNINISMQTSKLNSQRKGSFATLPSRQSRMAHIQKQMNLIKSSYEKRQSKRKQFTVGDQQNKKMVHSQNSEVKLNRVLVVRDRSKLAKKWQDRKFSGDIRNNMMSSKRLEQKQSDIKSQRSAYAPTNKLRERERYLRDNNQEEIQTVNSRSKSRIQQMKYQQYIQIKKSEKNYLQDFISVLEDQQTNLQNILSSNTSRITRPTETSIKFDDSHMNSTQALRIKTRQAILNSRKVINKVKGIPYKVSLNQ